MPLLRSMTALARWLSAPCLSLACAAGNAGTSVTPPPPRLHYTMASHTFAVADAGRSPDERSMARDVEWTYPIFTDTRDPAVRALNAWLRQQSLELLLGDKAGAVPPSDAQVVAQAAADQDFIDGGIDQAVITPEGAFGRYRSFRYNSEMIGGTHPSHALSSPLYSLDRRAEISVADLFKPDDEGVLPALYDAQVHSPTQSCPDQEFSWRWTSLVAEDTLGFEYPFAPGRGREGVDCLVVVIQSPAIARLLKSPRSLRPRFELVDDTARPAVHHAAKASAAAASAASAP
ncbi:hypothetical protein [Scleromatobacter humisilvae]|uniref:Uncharacterized protein n=1 Tax=Scleromatobacter humisilvae TaxID=2897159 RepID=A0A9X1YMD1_9BURK|nr:hypothetical protein [Scleromatobacter humisilvae]MCK9687052.1 hypothetical protein [Scleromatobacter humisilvae]